MKNKLITALMIIIPGLATVASVQAATPAQTSSETIVRAQFSPKGEVVLPTDFRHWVHVGTFIKESGINIFDNSKITAPLIFNTYVEPSAYRHYMSTGQWADGAQIVKEITQAQSGNNCDDKVTHVCKTSIGAGIFQDSYEGIGYMVKDVKRFPNEAGNWAFFTSGHLKPPYPEMAMIKPQEDCAACHIKHANDQDYVFSAQKVGLDRSNPSNK